MAVTAALVGGLTIPSVGFVNSASAASSRWEYYDVQFGPDVITDACGVSGLNLEQVDMVSGRFRMTLRGPDEVPYFDDRADTIATTTNLATGESLTFVGSFRGGALKVTDNGDGTYTVLVSNTDNAFFYDDEGQVVGRETGVYRYEFLADYAGTPMDPSDDQFTFLRVVKRTGLDADYCRVVLDTIA
jgi:hypothetical protein